jgi:hypothetical protein
MAERRQKVTKPKVTASRKKIGAAARSPVTPLVYVTNPRATPPTPVTLVVPELREGSHVIEVFGIAIGGVVEAVRGVVIADGQPIPRVLNDENSVLGNFYRVRSRGFVPQYMWRFERGGTKRSDTRLLIAPPLENKDLFQRLVVAAKIGGSWVFAAQLDLVIATEISWLARTPAVVRRFCINPPADKSEVSRTDLAKGLYIKANVDLNSRPLTGLRAKIFKTSAAALTVNFSYESFTASTTKGMYVPGATIGTNTLIVEGEFEGYQDDWVPACIPSILVDVK